MQPRDTLGSREPGESRGRTQISLLFYLFFAECHQIRREIAQTQQRVFPRGGAVAQRCQGGGERGPVE